MNNDYDLLIIGGGAAGFFAAARCGEGDPSLRVAILERGKRVLEKVRVSGGGRCNVTHSCFDPRELIEFYPRGGRELLGPFHHWGPAETIDWFEARGVTLKTESDGRMFPMSDDSETIIACLQEAIEKVETEVILGTVVEGIERMDGGYLIRSKDGKRYAARSVLVASGGLREGALMTALKYLGHRIERLAPSLFTFHVKDQRIDGLAGLSVAKVSVSVAGQKLETSGPILVTHWGVSGPAVLKLSSWGARWMQEESYRFDIVINWLGGKKLDVVEEELARQRQSRARRSVVADCPYSLPRRLWERLVEGAGIGDKTTWAQLSSSSRRQLASELVAGRFQVSGKSMNKDEFVTCGGVSLRDVDFRSMQSKRSPGLYFAGEVLDLDALTGGFNFQAAWTTATLAARSIGQSVA